MSRDLIVVFAMVLVLVGGAVVALVWWSLADRFFPGAARSTGQGLPRQRQDAKPKVVRGFDAEPSPPSPPADSSGGPAEPPTAR